MRQQYDIVLEKEAIDLHRRKALGILQYDLNQGLPIRLDDREREVFSEFFGVYEALYERLDKVVNGTYPSAVKAPFLSMYAAHVAADHVLVLHGGAKNKHQYCGISFISEDAAVRRDALLRGPFQEYLANRDTEPEALPSLLSSLRTASEAAAKNGNYAGIRGDTSSFRVRIGDASYAGPTADGLERVLEPVSDKKIRVIGNHEMMRGIKAALYQLSYFDGKTNPINRFQRRVVTINIQGDPGTGKTMGIAECYEWAKRTYGLQMNVPMEMIGLTNEIKSSLFGQSAENLRGIFRRIREGKSAYVVVADDIESVIHDRRGLTHSPEEKNITNTLINELQGLFSEDKGNYLFISTSNHPLQLDPAVDDRLSQLILFAPGPQTPEEYADIFQEHLAEGIAAGYVAVEDWTAIGECAKGTLIEGQRPRPISGRHVLDITTHLTLRDVAIPLAETGRLLSLDELTAAHAETRIGTSEIIAAIEGSRGRNGKHMRPSSKPG